MFSISSISFLATSFGRVIFRSSCSCALKDTLAFSDVQQLKYFEKGLTALKNGNNGDIATFKDYSIKRADKKYDGTWYILRIKFGLTDFKQTEADILTKTIRGL